MIDPAVTIAAEPAAAATVPETPVAETEQDFDDFHEAERSTRTGKPSSTEKPAPVKPAVEAKVEETQPKSDAATDKPKERKEPSPQDLNLRKLDAEKRRVVAENRELRERLSKLESPSPKADTAPAKTEVPVEDPEPDPDKYDFEDATKWLRDHAAWAKREMKRQLNTALSERDTETAKATAKAEGEKRMTRLNEVRAEVEKELPDWADVVLGTEEADGIAALLPKSVKDWCDDEPEVSFRGLYALAQLPEAEQEAFFKLNNVRKVAKLVQLGEQKTSAPAPVAPAPGAGKRAAPPPKTVSSAIPPSADIEASDDFDTVHEHWRAQAMQHRIRR